MADYNWGRPITGTDDSETIIADFAAADAIFREDTVWWPGYGYINVQYFWNRDVRGLGGHDTILRDRPGDYKVGPQDGNVAVNGGTWTNGTLVDTGNDTVSYAMYGAGMDIDLDTGDGRGTAEANIISGVEIFGVDWLYGIENAIGTAGIDNITGSSVANKLYGGGSGDDIRGELGNDRLYGDAGNDVMRGDEGLDSVYGGTGNDTVYAGDGNDSVEGGDHNDALYGGDGADVMKGGSGNDSVYAGDHNDILYGGSGANYLHGGSGNDHIALEGAGSTGEGYTGNDTVIGSTGNDQLFGGSEDDSLAGGSGNDTLDGGTGADAINGGSGTDRAVWTTSGAVFVNLNDAGNGTANQSGTSNDDALTSIEQVQTGSGHDSIILGSGANWVSTQSGNDTVTAGSGNDTAYGGSGEDQIDGGSGSDYLRGGDQDDQIAGGWGDDLVYGDEGDDVLSGAQDDDRLYGGSGDDTIRGGTGDDTVSGGSGADGFIWANGDWGTDVIEDFVIGEDWLSINAYLASPVQAGGSYVGKVFAFFAENGESTAISVQTTGGWQTLAILRGYEDPNEVWDAIYDGSLFSAPTLGGDGPGDVMF